MTLNIDISILEAIKDSQGQHGLKYENYQRYRSYCSRRLHRLRRSINVHQGVPSSAKTRHQRAKKLIDINAAMVVEAGQKTPEYSERMLLIPLFLAERAWSYAMQLKQEVNEQPRKKYHLIRRLKKAMIYAQKFERLCHEDESPCQERTKIEAVAYAAYISGLYFFETGAWIEAKDHLSKALDIYFKLNVWSDYQERVDEIKASLRYCNFNLTENLKNSDRHDETMTTLDDIPSNLEFKDVAFFHLYESIFPSINEAPSSKMEQDPPSSEDNDDELWDDACETLG